MSIKFKTAYDRPETIPVSSGDKIRIEYALRHTPQGDLYLEKVAEHDIQAEIESFLPMTDLQNIVERYNATGDSSILQQRTGAFYGDFSEIPETMADAVHGAAAFQRLYEHQDKNEFPTIDSFLAVFSDPDRASAYLAKKAKDKEEADHKAAVAKAKAAKQIDKEAEAAQ